MKRKQKRHTRKPATRRAVVVHDTVVSQLVGADPGIGWIFSIRAAAQDTIDAHTPWPAELSPLIGRKQDLRPFLARELVQAAQQAAKEASAEILALRLTDDHPLSPLIAKAMQAVHLGWQAEILQARDSSYFLQATIQKRGGAASVAARRASAQLELDTLARASADLQRDRQRKDSLRPVRLRDVAQAANMPLAKLQSSRRTLAAIRNRAAELAHE